MKVVKFVPTEPEVEGRIATAACAQRTLAFVHDMTTDADPALMLPAPRIPGSRFHKLVCKVFAVSVAVLSVARVSKTTSLAAEFTVTLGFVDRANAVAIAPKGVV